MSTYSKPLPEADEFSGPYWQGMLQGKLLLQKCQKCGQFQDFARGICRYCFSNELEWGPASGKGTVYSFSNIYRAPASEFAKDVPYTVAIIELEEGIRMMSNIVGLPVDQVKIGMPVEVVFDKVTPEVALPKFRPYIR